LQTDDTTTKNTYSKMCPDFRWFLVFEEVTEVNTDEIEKVFSSFLGT